MYLGRFKYVIIKNYPNKPCVEIEAIKDENTRMYNECIYDADIYKEDDNSLTIYGHLLKIGYSCEKTNVNDLSIKPQPQYIKHNNGLKLFGRQIIEPYDYVRYYYAFETKKSVTYKIAGNYILKY